MSKLRNRQPPTASRRPEDLAPILAVAAFMVATYATLLLDREALDWLTQEDGLYEDIGAVGLLAASVLFFVAFLRSKGRGLALRILLLGLAVALFVGFGEEVGWGYRWLGLEAPESVRTSDRPELNIHNIEQDDLGARLQQAFKLGWLVFAVGVPVAARASSRLARRLSGKVPILPLWLAAAFAVNQALRLLLGTDALSSGFRHTEHAVDPVYNLDEIWEVNFAVLAGLAGFLVARGLKARRAEGARVPGVGAATGDPRGAEARASLGPSPF